MSLPDLLQITSKRKIIMPNTNTVIVYRSQQEQFWDNALMSGDAFVYIVWFVALVGVIVGTVWLYSKLTSKRRY